MFDFDFRRINDRRATIDKAIQRLNIHKQRLQSRRRQSQVDDCVEEGECLERNGASLENKDKFTLLCNIQGQQEMLGLRNQEIAALKEQIEVANKKHAVEQEHMKKKHAAELEQTKLALAKAEKDVARANNGKKQLSERNSDLKRKLAEITNATGKQAVANEETSQVVSTILFHFNYFLV